MTELGVNISRLKFPILPGRPTLGNYKYMVGQRRHCLFQSGPGGGGGQGATQVCLICFPQSNFQEPLPFLGCHQKWGEGGMSPRMTTALCL